MNRGFGFYFKKSWSVTLFAYKRLSFLKKLELTVFMLVCLIGCSIFFLRPIFSIALMNAARMIEESHNLSVSKCFEGINKNDRFKELLVAEIYVFFLVAVIVGLCFLPNIVQFGFVPRAYRGIMPVITIVTVSLASIISILVELRYLALPYIASSTINTSAGDMLLNARRMKGSAIFTQTMLIIVFGLLAILPVGIVEGANILLYNTVYAGNQQVIFWVLLVLYILIPVVLFFPSTLFFTMLQTSLYQLYKDTVSIKKVYVVKELPGTEVGYASIFPTDKDEVELIKEEKIGGKK